VVWRDRARERDCSAGRRALAEVVEDESESVEAACVCRRSVSVFVDAGSFFLFFFGDWVDYGGIPLLRSRLDGKLRLIVLMGMALALGVGSVASKVQLSIVRAWAELEEKLARHVPRVQLR
jgi:hypothetical protein